MENKVHCTKYIQHFLGRGVVGMKKDEEKISQSQNGSSSRFLEIKGPI